MIVITTLIVEGLLVLENTFYFGLIIRDIGLIPREISTMVPITSELIVPPPIVGSKVLTEILIREGRELIVVCLSLRELLVLGNSL